MENKFYTVYSREGKGSFPTFTTHYLALAICSTYKDAKKALKNLKKNYGYLNNRTILGISELSLEALAEVENREFHSHYVVYPYTNEKHSLSEAIIK